MPTPSSGSISFLNLKNTFGTGNPVSMATLYRGGTNVPNITPDNSIPTTGPISMHDFYSTWGKKTLSFTMTVGSVPYLKKGYFFGFGRLTKGGSFGSLSTSVFLTPNGTMTIEGLYYSTGTQAWHLQLSSASSPADSDLSFRNVTVSGYNIGGVRSARNSTIQLGTARRWNWHAATNSHPTSGTIACTISYYG